MIIRPSLLAANPLNLIDDIESMRAFGINHFHIDMMDYHFTHNFGIMPKTCQALIDAFPDIRLDVHLMTKPTPIHLVASLINMGIKEFSLHLETLSDTELESLIQNKDLTIRAALTPNTPITALSSLPTNQVLILAVSPGFSGQSMDPQALKVLEEAKALNLDVIFDGGVNLETTSMILPHNPESVVIGSGLFNASKQEQQALINQLMDPQD